MSILNKTLWLLVIIYLLLLPTFAQDSLKYNVIQSIDSREYHEDVSNLQLEPQGYDTYDDGTAVIIFTQGNEKIRFDAKIHMRIIFVNKTIVPVDIDCSHIPDFVYEQKFDGNTIMFTYMLEVTALINGYVLIDSNRVGKQIIVSWDGKIQRYR
jgi:hypothetical protein